jgi:transcriptional regulator with XRE-family HTH domain
MNKDNILGKVIKTLRKEKGLTQKELSELACIGYDNLRKIETGRVNNPSFFVIMMICVGLKISMNQFCYKMSQENLNNFKPIYNYQPYITA